MSSFTPAEIDALLARTTAAFVAAHAPSVPTADDAEPADGDVIYDDEEASYPQHRYSADLDSCTCGGQIVYFEEAGTHGCTEAGPIFVDDEATDAFLRRA